jgi:hypothetical protein
MHKISYRVALCPGPLRRRLEGEEKRPGTYGLRMRQYLPESICTPLPLHQQAMWCLRTVVSRASTHSWVSAQVTALPNRQLSAHSRASAQVSCAWINMESAHQEATMKIRRVLAKMTSTISTSSLSQMTN